MNSQIEARLSLIARHTNFVSKEFSTKEELNVIKKKKLPRRGQRRRFEEAMLNTAKTFRSIPFWLVLVLLQLSLAQATKRSASPNELGKL